MKKILLPILAIALASCCSEHDKSAITHENGVASLKDYKSIGDSITIVSQQTLLQNVKRELQAGGPAGAVDFCHVNASPITDSLSKKHGVQISRISELNRNPGNKANAFEISLLEAMHSTKTLDTLIVESGTRTYYKSIYLEMPACLKCHGNPESDISEETLKAIQQRYPSDKATGYSMNTLRGAWKVVFKD